MAHFTSLDGTDSNGVRAEVSVMTGSGRIKEVNPRGNPGPDGTYRNVEVVFDPDNPHLQRKVYAMLDTTAKELHELVQAALSDQRTINYRIESQRKRGIDRTTKFEDLRHSEQVVRILAAVDEVYSHEAKTNPMEDPGRDHPSALGMPAPAANVASAPAAGIDMVAVLRALDAARTAGAPASIVDALSALALAAGADMAQVIVDVDVDFASPAVARAADAEQFSLNHLVTIYSTPASPRGKPIDVQVTDEIISQSASLALELLAISDKVQKGACRLDAPDRAAASYGRALALVLDGVDKRYPFPIGQSEADISDWFEQVRAEAAERLYGLGCISKGHLPLSGAERDAGEASNVIALPSPMEEPPLVEEPEVEHLAAGSIAEMLDATVEAPDEALDFYSDAPAEEPPAQSDADWMSGPKAGSPEFQEPGTDLLGRLRDLCVAAGAANNLSAVSDWLESKFGERTARKVHAPTLDKFLAHYEMAGADVVRAEILGAA